MNNLPRDFDLLIELINADPQMAEFTEDEKTTYCYQAINIGREYAERFATWSFEACAKEYKVSISMMKGGVFCGKLLRAHYDHSVRAITVYEDGIKDIMRMPIESVIGMHCSLDNVREMLIWHEFFHVLEFKEIGFVGKKLTQKKSRFIDRLRNSNRYSLSEVAAFSFAKEKMALKRNPIIIDYLSQNRDMWADSI